MQRYQLPLVVLLETMAESQATVTLRAHLSALPESWDEECVADLVMVHGSLHMYTISAVEGRFLLQQEAAFQMLLRVGAAEWTMLPPSTSLLPPYLPGPLPAASQQASPDWKAVPLLPEILTTLSHRHKQVLLLVGDGKRPEEIARLLQRSLPEVEHILEEIRQQRLIYALSFGRSSQ